MDKTIWTGRKIVKQTNPKKNKAKTESKINCIEKIEAALFFVNIASVYMIEFWFLFLRDNN